MAFSTPLHRNMHDLLHTSTSCHFKMCLKSHTVTLLGQRLDESLLWRFRRLSRRWKQGSLYNSLTFSEELVSLRICWPISHQPSSDFRAVRPYRLRHLLCPDREKNEVKTAKDDPLSLVLKITHSLISIIEEFHRQGVRCVVFGSLVFHRHHSGYNKRCNRLNKLLRKHTRCEYYKPF